MREAAHDRRARENVCGGSRDQPGVLLQEIRRGRRTAAGLLGVSG